MRIYVVRGDPTFSMLQLAADAAFPWRGGVAVAGSWEEIEFTEVDDKHHEFIAADCLAINTGADGFLVSEFARDVLQPSLDAAAEFWPVRVFGYRYWWLNCLACVDALDREGTDADWSTVEGTWGAFSWISTTRRLAFVPNHLIDAPPMFRIPEYPQGVLLSVERVRRVVNKHKLTGFQFDLVWSAEHGGVNDPPGVEFGGIFHNFSQPEVDARRARACHILSRRVRGS